MSGRVCIGEESIICAEVRIEGEGSLTVGKNCYIGQRTLINAAESVKVEDGVGIGSDSSIFTHGVWVSYLEGLPRKFAPVMIGKNSWIPPRCLILPGVTIGSDVILATGAVVTKDIPDKTFAGGIPATTIRTVEDLRENVDHGEKDRRVREILLAFANQMGKLVGRAPKAIAFGKGVLYEVPSRAGRDVFSLYYEAGKVCGDILRLLASSRFRSDELAVVGLEGFTEEAKRLLEKEIPLVWFDLENFTRRRCWNRLSVLLRDFFRSRYGVRFVLECK